MADNSRYHEEARFALEAREVEGLHETLDRLRVEVDDLRASRQRLVVAADDARRSIERELHDGVQQHLIALSVSLQLASRCVESEPAAAKALLDEMGRDVQQAIDETARLAQRIHPPFVAAGGLAAALRVAAASAGPTLEIEAAGDATYPPAIDATIYLCLLEALEHAGTGARATVTVREEGEGVAFEVAAHRSGATAVAADGDVQLDGLRDRVEALGGRLTVRSGPGEARVIGSLPLTPWA